MDFGMLPPEVNSLRMYSGPGSAPMLAAVTAWDGLADEMHLTATVYESVISDLVNEGWLGPASTTMVAAVTPYVTWMSLTGLQAAQTASQAAGAAAAFEAAFALTVPPAVVAANRARLIALVATNFLGINTPAIAATEAEYFEMWAQDAMAMYAYAASAAEAVALAPFTEPAQTTNPSGQAGQAAAVTQATGGAVGSLTQTQLPQLMSALPNSLQGLASPAGAVSDVVTSLDPGGLLADLLNFLDGNDGNPYGIFLNSNLINGIVSAGYTAPASLFPAVTSALADVSAVMVGQEEGVAVPIMGDDPGEAVWGGATAPHSGSGAATGGMSQASSVGRLSVPPSWTSAVEVANRVGTALPGASSAAVPEAGAGMHGVPGMPAAGPYARNYGNGPRYGCKLTIMPRPLPGG